MERNLQASKRTGARSFYLSTLPSRLMGTGHLGVDLHSQIHVRVGLKGWPGRRSELSPLIPVGNILHSAANQHGH